MLLLPDMNSAASQPATLAAFRLPLIVFSFYDDDDDLLLAWMFQRWWLGIFLTSLLCVVVVSINGHSDFVASVSAGGMRRPQQFAAAAGASEFESSELLASSARSVESFQLPLPPLLNRRLFIDTASA